MVLDVKLLRFVIIAKLCALVVLALSMGDYFYIGEKPVSAQTEGSPTQEEEQLSARFSDLMNIPEVDGNNLRKKEVEKYLSIVENKKQQIKQRLLVLKKREQDLKNLEKLVEGKIEKLDQERKFFSQTLQREKKLKGERLEALVSYYGKMEPKKAAPIFENLDKDLVVSLFEKLQQKQITKILESMNPDKSTEISEYYGRVRSTREYEILKEMNTSLREAFATCKEPDASVTR